jgi:hypothetical protein
MVRVDSSRFPLLIVEWRGAITDQELSDFFASMDALADRAANTRQHYAVLSDGEASFSAVQRHRIAAWIAGFPALRKHWDRGNYVVIASAVGRGVLTAIKWVAPALTNVYVFASREEAEQAALQAMAMGEQEAAPRSPARM